MPRIVNGREVRPDRVPTVNLFIRVPEDVRDAVDFAAERSGLSRSYYFQKLVEQMNSGTGLPVLERTSPQREELPIEQLAS